MYYGNTIYIFNGKYDLVWCRYVFYGRIQLCQFNSILYFNNWKDRCNAQVTGVYIKP